MFLAVILGHLQPLGVKLPIIVEMPLGRMWLWPLRWAFVFETHHASTRMDLDGVSARETIDHDDTELVCKQLMNFSCLRAIAERVSRLANFVHPRFPCHAMAMLASTQLSLHQLPGQAEISSSMCYDVNPSKRSVEDMTPHGPCVDARRSTATDRGCRHRSELGVEVSINCRTVHPANFLVCVLWLWCILLAAIYDGDRCNG